MIGVSYWGCVEAIFFKKSRTEAFIASNKGIFLPLEDLLHSSDAKLAFVITLQLVYFYLDMKKSS